ncbi:NUDIX hydrolase [Propionicicella superfundia]|uniref:NUDIX hydrolase n=1 Tax=Propionicicella superfundia TaxID=348582 RepID=UPI000402C269|nr:NUDIX domain-containing protein [Propionicicella superfundia]
MDEIVGLVARDGTVVGTAPRSRVRRENLRHAATAVLVRNTPGDIYVQMRSPEKDWCPSCHDAAAGGVLRAGEDPAANAARELGEELAIAPESLRPLGTSLFEDDTVRVFEHVFETVWDGAIRFADGEVVAGGWVSLEDLRRRLADPGWPFVPDTRLLLLRLARRGVGDYARLLAD